MIAGRLLEAGHRLSIVVRRPEIVQALENDGFRLRDEKGLRTVRGPVEVHADLPSAGAFDFILLTTQPNQVEEAAASAMGLLAPGGAFVVFQNGLCEQRLCDSLGDAQVIGAVVAWGASTSAPGVFERTSQGGFTLGRWSGAQDGRLGRLAVLLRAVGQVEQTENLRGARWSKLAFNAAVSSLGTLGGARLGKLLRYGFVRRLALEIMSETVLVARAAGVRLEKVAGTVDLNWLALTPRERTAPWWPTLLAKHAFMLAAGAKYRRLRSSMLAAIERGREPPIDFLNGEIVRQGERLGVPTPVNRAVVAAVRDVAARRRPMGVGTLRELSTAG